MRNTEIKHPQNPGRSQIVEFLPRHQPPVNNVNTVNTVKHPPGRSQIVVTEAFDRSSTPRSNIHKSQDERRFSEFKAREMKPTQA